ncbi:MAG: N-acetyltransferase [Lachnospiraceae bacterium]|nr:N-acetyltransferase [Lachnospiraceae bacterium]
MEFKYEKNRIYSTNDSGVLLAEITYPDTKEGFVDINRTFVDPSLRGQGIAGKLMKMACEEIKKQGKKAVLSCPYAIKWIAENKEYQCILSVSS